MNFTSEHNLKRGMGFHQNNQITFLKGRESLGKDWTVFHQQGG